MIYGLVKLIQNDGRHNALIII